MDTPSNNPREIEEDPSFDYYMGSYVPRDKSIPISPEELRKEEALFRARSAVYDGFGG